MIILILFLVFGSILTYLSQHNLTPVSLNIGPYVLSDIPLFYVIVGSLITGLIFSYAVYLLHDISTFWTLRGKDNRIKKEKGEVLELTKRIHVLERENERLQNGENISPQKLKMI